MIGQLTNEEFIRSFPKAYIFIKHEQFFAVTHYGKAT